MPREKMKISERAKIFAVNNKIKVTNFGEITFTNYGSVTSSKRLLFSLCYNFLIVQRRLL